MGGVEILVPARKRPSPMPSLPVNIGAVTVLTSPSVWSWREDPSLLLLKTKQHTHTQYALYQVPVRLSSPERHVEGMVGSLVNLTTALEGFFVRLGAFPCK